MTTEECLTDDYREMWGYCRSECVDVPPLAFGLEFTGSVDEQDSEWIYEGIGDSYFENSWQFDDYIEKANQLINSKGISREAALKQIFGRFIISFEIDGKPAIIKYDEDAVNDQMYELLSYHAYLQ
ncbi:MAG: hypothetical protein IJI33_06415 [Solobacterium sp.]|nr:hypothetical protein [Solobacterium sp.]